jgi:hypothetical protein
VCSCVVNRLEFAVERGQTRYFSLEVERVYLISSVESWEWNVSQYLKQVLPSYSTGARRVESSTVIFCVFYTHIIYSNICSNF